MGKITLYDWGSSKTGKMRSMGASMTTSSSTWIRFLLGASLAVGLAPSTPCGPPVSAAATAVAGGAAGRDAQPADAMATRKNRFEIFKTRRT